MLIVNLTTTFQRIDLCRIALTSLLLQSRLPDHINLWISKEPYLRDQGIAQAETVDKLIHSLPEAGRNRINIRWVPNTGPYRKLIPMLREAKTDDVLVTADDDIFYGEDWLSGLMQAFEEAEGKLVAARVRAEKINFLGKKTSYLYWKLICQPSTVTDNFVVTFGGGAVLTKSMFRYEDILDDSFLEVAPTADDLWYSKLIKLNHNEVVVVPSLLKELHFVQHNDGLTTHNLPLVISLFRKIRLRLWDKSVGFLGVSACGNDMAYRKIERHFSTGLGE